MALSPEQLAQYRGHPTAPGIRDESVRRVGRQDVADGRPGVPRIWRQRHSDGPGIPYGSQGPVQPQIRYEGEPE